MSKQKEEEKRDKLERRTKARGSKTTIITTTTTTTTIPKLRQTSMSDFGVKRSSPPKPPGRGLIRAVPIAPSEAERSHEVVIEVPENSGEAQGPNIDELSDPPVGDSQASSSNDVGRSGGVGSVVSDTRGQLQRIGSSGSLPIHPGAKKRRRRNTVGSGAAAIVKSTGSGPTDQFPDPKARGRGLGRGGTSGAGAAAAIGGSPSGGSTTKPGGHGRGSGSGRGRGVRW